MSGILKTNMKKPIAPETKASASTHIVAETQTESLDIGVAYQVAKAQNEVLLALIHRYFDFNETAITQGFEFLNKLLTEGLDFAKNNLESRDAHTEVRLEMELEESKHRQEIEKEKLANQHEIARIDLGLSKARQEIDTKIRLQELAESKSRYNLERTEQNLRNIERLAELRKTDPNHEISEIWSASFFEDEIENATDSNDGSNTTEDQTIKVTEKLAEWGFLNSPMTKDAVNNIEDIITNVTAASKKATEKPTKKEPSAKKVKNTPKI
jgi:hypothetical protein